MVMSATGPSQVSATRGSGMNMSPLRLDWEGKTDEFGRKDRCWHCLAAVGDGERERRLRKDVPRDVDARGDLGDDQARRRQLHHAALGDISHVLPLLDGA